MSYLERFKKFVFNCIKIMSQQPMIIKTDYGEGCYDQSMYMTSKPTGEG